MNWSGIRSVLCCRKNELRWRYNVERVELEVERSELECVSRDVIAQLYRDRDKDNQVNKFALVDRDTQTDP